MQKFPQPQNTDFESWNWKLTEYELIHRETKTISAQLTFHTCTGTETQTFEQALRLDETTLPAEEAVKEKT